MAILGLRPSKKKQETIAVQDAMILENYEQVQRTNARTARAIKDTYGPKQPTKFRRKLPGKRKWKNKSLQYAKVSGQMIAKEFNAKQAAMKVLDRLYKEKAAKRQEHSLVD